MANAQKAPLKDPPPFITLSSRETLGWSLGLFLLFGGLFFFGVLVGRGSIVVELIPTAVQRELATIPDKQAVPQVAAAPEAPGSSVELSFYKEVKLSEEAVTKSSRMKKAAKTVLTPAQAPRLPEAAPPKVPPSAPGAPRPAPEAAPRPTAPTSGFTIQVAAHIQRASAEAEAETLNRQGFPAYVLAAKNSKGQTWYRVRVGHFAQRSDAALALTRLARVKGKAYVVKL